MFEYRPTARRAVNRQTGPIVRFGTAGPDCPGTEVVAMTDRRVRRTRRILREALVALVIERGYERITVQDVLDRADVGRSTFYAHFRDKDALFLSCFDDLRDDLRHELDVLEPGQPPRDPARPVAVLFDHAYRNRDIYRAVCGRAHGNVVTRHLLRLIAEVLTEHLSAVGTRLPVEIVAEYFAGALFTLLVWWVRRDFPYAPREMARMCQELTAPGIVHTVSRDHPPPGHATPEAAEITR